LKVKIGEVANSKEELNLLLQEFPPEAEVDGEVISNGRTIFNALYSIKVKELVTFICDHKDGSVNAYGPATLVLLEGLSGKDDYKTGFIEISLYISQMTCKVIKALRT
jgi:hypothetical protein